LFVALLTVVVVWPTLAGAQDVEQLRQELEAHKKRTAELEDRINQLEARQRLKERSLSEKIEEVAEKAEAKETAGIPEVLQWAAKANWYGDFRYRYEYIDDDSLRNGAPRPDRHRNRIRARLGLDAEVTDEWGLGFRVGAGSADPVSSNQTLDEAFSSKPLWLDRALFTYTPAWCAGLTATGGKIGNPFLAVGKNELIWDSDLSFEGAALKYGMSLNDNTSLNLAGGGFYVNEESGGADTALWGLQGYLKHQIGNPTYLLVGASLFCYGNIKGAESLAAEWDDDEEEFFGNSHITDAAGNEVFAGDYDLLELFAEFGTEVAGMPVAVFGTWVHNSVAADENEDTGWLAGATINKAKKPGSWQFAYDYRELDLDAAVGQFTNSDFVGGGTGGKGHRFSLSYALAKNVVAVATYHLDEYDGRNDGADYDRIQADIKLSF
jgi:hypothetical protein